jgi:hypothetical protein
VSRMSGLLQMVLATSRMRHQGGSPTRIALLDVGKGSYSLKTVQNEGESF